METIIGHVIMGQYSVIREAVSANIHDKREKNPSEKPEGGRATEGFFTRIFLEFGVNI